MKVDLESGDVVPVGTRGTRDWNEPAGEVSVTLESETDQPDEISIVRSSLFMRPLPSSSAAGGLRRLLNGGRRDQEEQGHLERRHHDQLGRAQVAKRGATGDGQGARHEPLTSATLPTGFRTALSSVYLQLQVDENTEMIAGPDLAGEGWSNASVAAVI